MLRPQKGNSGVLSRNTLLNFGLCTNCPSTFYTLTFLRICFLTTSNALQIALMSSSFSGFLVITVQCSFTHKYEEIKYIRFMLLNSKHFSFSLKLSKKSIYLISYILYLTRLPGCFAPIFHFNCEHFLFVYIVKKTPKNRGFF